MTVLLTVALVILGLLFIIVAGLVIFSWLAARKAEQLVPPVGRYITVEGVRMHYLDEGSGPPIVMIHGLASQLQSFTYALNSRLSASHRLIMIDRPGCGYSEAASSGLLSEQARLVAGLMDKIQVKRALVVGHSLGGALSLAFAIDHPEKVAALALISPASQAQEAPPPALRLLAIRSDPMRWIIGWTVAIPSGIRNRKQTLAALFHPDPVADDFGTRGGALLTSRPWTFRAACRDLVEAGSEFGAYSRRVSEIAVPVGVLFGDGDQILDYRRHGESLRGQIGDFELRLLKDGGHMIPLIRPDETAAFIEEMAAKAGLRASAKAPA